MMLTYEAWLCAEIRRLQAAHERGHVPLSEVTYWLKHLHMLREMQAPCLNVEMSKGRRMGVAYWVEIDRMCQEEQPFKCQKPARRAVHLTEGDGLVGRYCARHAQMVLKAINKGNAGEKEQRHG
jgi:hypothetical protein